jgi:hypothetical protein
MPRKGAKLFQGQLDPDDHRQAQALMEKTEETQTKFLKRLVNQEYEKTFTDGGEAKEVLKATVQIESLRRDIKNIGLDIGTLKHQNQNMMDSLRTITTLLTIINDREIRRDKK